LAKEEEEEEEEEGEGEDVTGVSTARRRGRAPVSERLCSVGLFLWGSPDDDEATAAGVVDGVTLSVAEGEEHGDADMMGRFTPVSMVVCM
jgi:hypothetical protein